MMWILIHLYAYTGKLYIVGRLDRSHSIVVLESKCDEREKKFAKGTLNFFSFSLILATLTKKRQDSVEPNVLSIVRLNFIRYCLILFFFLKTATLSH